MKFGGRRVPILLTLDVHDQPDLARVVARSVEVLEGLALPVTYFVPADLYRRHRSAMDCIAPPHQVACHGLYHNGSAEFYDLMPGAQQRDYIRRATDILEDGLGRHPGAFRAPGFRISGMTLAALDECGYYADTSVNSGRLAITSSYTRENGMFRAPRLPYHPDADNAFRRGPLSIWEIPVSALVVPFTINTAVATGLRLGRAFAKLLYRECRQRPKPLVYVAHPEDLCEEGPTRGVWPFSFRMLLPSRHGFLIRYYLTSKDQRAYWGINQGLLDCLRRLRGAEFLTVEDYVARHLRASAGR